MRAPTRLSSEERRRAIVEAVKELFAEKGFDGTTTRELARAAGVSEALLYKHFPSKELLYDAMLDACTKGALFTEFNRIMALEPSTSTLVLLVHFLVFHLAGNSGDSERNAVDRLKLRSLLEDGGFIRLGLKRFGSAWVRKFDECLKAAAKAGDVRDVPLRRDLRGWFAHHVAFSLRLLGQTTPSIIDYGVSNQAMVEQAVWYMLLGSGVKEEAIRRYYNPKALSLLSDRDQE